MQQVLYKIGLNKNNCIDKKENAIISFVKLLQQERFAEELKLLKVEVEVTKAARSGSLHTSLPKGAFSC